MTDWAAHIQVLHRLTGHTWFVFQADGSPRIGANCSLEAPPSARFVFWTDLDAPDQHYDVCSSAGLNKRLAHFRNLVLVTST